MRIRWKSILIYNNIFCSSHPDPNKWPVQDISPQDGMFNVNDNEQVEFVLSGLLPNKQYFLKSAINVRDDSVDSGYQVGQCIDRYYVLVFNHCLVFLHIININILILGFGERHCLCWARAWYYSWWNAQKDWYPTSGPRNYIYFSYDQMEILCIAWEAVYRRCSNQVSLLVPL